MIVFKDGSTVENKEVLGSKKVVVGSQRETLTIEIPKNTYEQVASLFVDGASFSLQETSPKLDAEGNSVVIDGVPQYVTETYDKSLYCVAGDITDHRDSSFTVDMGQKTQAELLEEANAQLLMDMMGGV